MIRIKEPTAAPETLKEMDMPQCDTMRPKPDHYLFKIAAYPFCRMKLQSLSTSKNVGECGVPVCWDGRDKSRAVCRTAASKQTRFGSHTKPKALNPKTAMGEAVSRDRNPESDLCRCDVAEGTPAGQRLHLGLAEVNGLRV